MKLVYWLALFAAAMAVVFCSTSAVKPAKHSELLLEVRRTKDGGTAVLVDGMPRLTRNELADAISARLREAPEYVDELGTHPDIEVVIRGGRDIEFGAFRPALEACRECGIHFVTVASGGADAPLLLFDPRDLRGDNRYAVSIHPPRIKLLWVEKDSFKETNSPDGRCVMKIKDMYFPEKEQESRSSLDYDRLRQYLNEVLKHFRPLKSYPTLSAEIFAHWNVPFGVIVRCAAAVEEAGIYECCLADLPWRPDRNWQSWELERDRYEKLVEYASRNRRRPPDSSWPYLVLEEELEDETALDEQRRQVAFDRLVIYLASRERRRRRHGLRLLKSCFGQDFGYEIDAEPADRITAIGELSLWRHQNWRDFRADKASGRLIRDSRTDPGR